MVRDTYFFCSECGDGPIGRWMYSCPCCGTRAPPKGRSGATSSNTANNHKTSHEGRLKPSPRASKPIPAAGGSRSAGAPSPATTTQGPLSIGIGLKVGDPVYSLTDSMSLPVLIAGKWAATIPDLGAAVNAMSLATLHQFGVAYTKDRLPKSRRVFRAGDSEVIGPEFQVRLACQIPGLPESTNTGCRLTFYIFESLAKGVAIIGRQTLKLKKIYTNYRHLLTPHKETGRPIRKCLSISIATEVANKLPVYLNGILAEGVADTGCHQLVMRQDYAQQLNLHKGRIDFQKGESRTVVFASGREQAAEYKIRVTINAARSTASTVDAKQGLTEPQMPDSTSRKSKGRPRKVRKGIQMEAWVYRTLLYPLILNQELLMSMKGFEEHVVSFRTRKAALPELLPIMAVRKRKGNSLEAINDRESGALRDLEVERRHVVRELNEAKEDGDHEKQAQKRQKLDNCESEKQKVKQRYESERQKLVGGK